MSMKLTPGCYVDSSRGHYVIPEVIRFAHGHGFELTPFESFTLDSYEDHYADENYPTGAMDDLVDQAESWLNRNHEELEVEGAQHYFGFNDGDFGLYPVEDEI